IVTFSRTTQMLRGNIIKRLELKEGTKLPLVEEVEGILIKKRMREKSYEWEEKVDKLLNRIWNRVEQYPITEEEIDQEVEKVRAKRYVESRS
ncbi:MAG: hypothetical protein QME81_20475, partial [bacterium]|nr:hypothetical protein [bacterium]